MLSNADKKKQKKQADIGTALKPKTKVLRKYQHWSVKKYFGG